MTAANHMLTGAVIAVAARDPWVIVPASIASHFVLDAIPHFGVYSHDDMKRNRDPLFQLILSIDVLLSLALLVLLPSALSSVMSWKLVILGMLCAFLPDVVWVKGFVKQSVHGIEAQMQHWFVLFHKRIQWFEKPLGIFVEVVWFFSASLVLTLLAASI